MSRAYSRDIRDADTMRVMEKLRETETIGDDSEWMMEELRSYAADFSPDKPNLAFEQQRSNTDNVRNMHLSKRYGDGLSVHQPDLFLGDLTKDPRGVDTDPLMRKYKDQTWSRRDNYRKSFRDDETRQAFTGVKPQVAIQKARNNTFYGFKSRFKNFEESQESTGRAINVAKGS